MRRRQSVQTRFISTLGRAAIRLSDWVRRSSVVILLIGALFAGATVWLTLAASANPRLLKSWERLFGFSTSQRIAAIQPQVSSSISGYTVTTFDAPNAGTTAATGTVAASIDAAGDVAGTYIDSNMAAHGFFLPANGTMATFDAPGDGSGATQGTIAISMDSGGNYIAGMYADSGSQYHGFLRTNSSGAITTFDVGIYYTHQGTIALTVNSSGTVAGLYTSPNWSEQSGTPYYRGFVRTLDGTVSFFDAPDAGLLPSQGTIPVGINNSGEITGFYIDGKGVYEGFVRSSSGTITEFQVPCQGTTCYGTVPIGIDNAGDVVGAYGSTPALGNGFLRTANGTFTTIDAPGAATGNGKIQGTLPLGIDPTGSYITGLFSDSNGLYHGFVQTAAGTITTFDAPGAATSPVFMLSGTGAGGVNSSGTIVGAFGDSNAVFHGLLLTPVATAAATPSFSPDGGTYASAQSVTISDTTPGATIYYTTNGTTPTTSSTVYSGPITVSSSETIEAIAVANGYTNSAVGTATYTINIPVTATPTFSPATGAYTSAQSVTISDTTSTATIYYTTNGTTPTTSATVYSGPITVAASETIETIATASGFAPSTVASASYTISSSGSNAGEWVWTGGSDTVNQAGVYGTLGAPATGDVPGARESAISWRDLSGDLWLFGGTASNPKGTLNDLWKYTPSTGEWTWMGGSNTANQSGVYGTLGTPAAGNVPGARQGGVSWMDSIGNLWLFGGSGYDADGNQGDLNDLWKYTPSIGEWTWMGGSNTANQSGVYGTLGTPAAGNVPGARFNLVSWTDSTGNFWLFGGYGYDAYGNGGLLNDLWKYMPSTGQWTWISGSKTGNQTGVYGAQGVPAAGNVPGGRNFAVSWFDSLGNLWLFGGDGIDADANQGDLNDLWKYTPSTGQWTWMSGSNIGNNPGVYGTQGVPAAGNVPGPIIYEVSWADSSNNLWLFGGCCTLNALWVYTPSNGDWTWMGGSDAVNQPGVYGTQDIPAAANIPGARDYATTWTDSTGNFWLLGGYGFDANGAGGFLNDLWEYAPPAIAPPAITPTISPSAGTYAAAQSVTISDTTPGATIYYTTNGTTPTTSSSVYNGPITVSSSEIIEAIATASGYNQSAVTSATYVIQGTKITPVVSVASVEPSITSAEELVVNIAVAGTPTPTGSVTLSSGSYTSSATALSSGSVSIYIPGNSLAVGTDTLTATYTPDANSSSTYSSASGTNTITVAAPFGPPTGYQPSPILIEPGTTTGNTATISVVGVNGFSGQVNLTCAVTTSLTNVNDMPTCIVNPPQVTLSGTTAQTSTLTVTTTAPSIAANVKQRRLGSVASGTALTLIALFLVPRRRRTWLAMLGLFVLFISTSAIGCGGGGSSGGIGGGNSGTTAGNYTITVTGTSGTVSVTVGTVALTVR